MKTFKLTEAERILAVIRMQQYMEQNKEAVLARRERMVDDLKKVMLDHINAEIRKDDNETLDGIENYKLMALDEFVTLSALAHFTVDILISLAMSRRIDFNPNQIENIAEIFLAMFDNIIDSTLNDKEGLKRATEEMKSTHDKLHMAGRSDSSH